MFTRCVNTPARERGVVSHYSGALAPVFLCSFAVENCRDVRQADDQRCNKSCSDDRRASSRVNYPKVLKVKTINQDKMS